MKRVSVTVAKEDAGQRLDKFLAARAGLSRGVCRRAITDGGVWLQKRRLRRLSLPVVAGWVLEIVIDDGPSKPVEPEVLFEDEALLVVAKPAGLSSQGTLATDTHSVLGWGQRHGGKDVRTVHRLDVGTSGVLVLAKTAVAATALSAQFRAGTVEKRYLAIAVGTLPEDSGRITDWLAKGRRPGAFEIAQAGFGIPADTSYQVLARQPPLLLVEAVPHTGRTHQIRVHLSGAGAPLLGDTRYGGPTHVRLGIRDLQSSRALLHAAELRLDHPVTGARQTFCLAPPPDFADIAAAVRTGN